MQHDVGLKVYELRRRRYIASKLRRWRLGLTRIPEQPDTLDLEDDEFVTLPLEGRLTFAYSKSQSIAESCPVLPSDKQDDDNDGCGQLSANEEEEEPIYMNISRENGANEGSHCPDNNNTNSLVSSPSLSSTPIKTAVSQNQLQSSAVTYGEPPINGSLLETDSKDIRYHSTLPALFKSRSTVKNIYSSDSAINAPKFLQRSDEITFGKPPNLFDDQSIATSRSRHINSYSTLPARFKTRRKQVSTTPSHSSYSWDPKISDFQTMYDERVEEDYPLVNPNATLPCRFRSRRTDSRDSLFRSLTSRKIRRKHDVGSCPKENVNPNNETPAMFSRSASSQSPIVASNVRGRRKRPNSETCYDKSLPSHPCDGPSESDPYHFDMVQSELPLNDAEEDFKSCAVKVELFDEPINISISTIRSPTPSEDPAENVAVHNVHSLAGILDLDDVMLDVVADKDVLVAEFEEETPYIPVPIPDIKQIFNQGGAGESSAAGSEQSTERTKPQTINDSSYFSQEERMAWIDKWVQDADTTDNNPTSPIPLRDEPQPRMSEETSVRPVRADTGRAIEPPRELNDEILTRERGIESVIRERGIESVTRERGFESVTRERGIESTPRERGIDSIPREKDIASGPQERGIDSEELNSAQNDKAGERAIDAPFQSPSDPTTSGPSSPEHIKVVLTKEDGPLGLNVELVESGSPGLYIVSIEPDSAAEREGSLRLGDQVVEVNGVHLTNIPLVRVMDVYQELTTLAQMRLTVKRLQLKAVQLPVVESSPDNLEEFTSKSRDTFELTLNKGQKGLGFTIATREYTACQGYSPLFVKTVHRHGTAATDGRMKSNDVLLKVNGKSVVGMPQQAVVAMMRELKGQVTLTLQRTASELPPESDPAPLLPISLPTAPVASTRTRLALDIPLVTPDGRPVGLGISVKGKSMSIKGEPRKDHGIFIKSILKGGAADLDCRLKADDQLLAADNQTLKGLTNKEAMLVLKKSLEQAGKMTSLNLVVSRKDGLNLSAESRSSKPYSSFKGSNHNLVQHSASLSSDPNRYRALSLSSPNLGRKKKHHVEFDTSRGVAFNENIQSIPQAGDVLESDEDVVFVGHLGEQLDPFNRESLFRKSMKKIDHAPITPGIMRRASSQEMLTSTPPVVPVLKKGISQESVFSGRDGDPLYATIAEATDYNDTVREPPKINDSFQNAVQNGKIPSVDVTQTPTSQSEEKPKSKNFLKIFSKKNNKKSKEDSNKLNVDPADVSKTAARQPDFKPVYSSTPYNLAEEHGSRHRSSNRSDGEFSSSSRPRDTREVGQEREHPRAPGNKTTDSGSHKRSKSSDFFRDKELADQSGGYIEHRVQDKDYRDYMARGPDRHSNRSNNSGRSSGDRPRDQSYAQYPPRDNAGRDHSRDRPARERSRDRLARDSSRDHLARDSSRDRAAVRDHPMRDIPNDSRYSREPPREAAHARDSRDRRYLETTQFRYGRSSPHPNPVHPPHYADQFKDQARFSNSNSSLNNSLLNNRHDNRLPPSALDLRPPSIQDNRPPFQPMIPQPISYLQGRQNTEQLSDV